jgi:hypothetical protein
VRVVTGVLVMAGAAGVFVVNRAVIVVMVVGLFRVKIGMRPLLRPLQTREWAGQDGCLPQQREQQQP